MVRVATHRAASASEPYLAIASRSSCSWYAGRAPAAVDDEPDAVVCGISRSLAQGTEEGWIEVGHTRNLVIEDRRAVGDGTVGLAKRTTVLTAKDADT